MILHLSLAPCEIFDVLLGMFQIHRFQCSQKLQEQKVTGYGSSAAGLVAKISLRSILTSFPCFPHSGDKAIPSCPASFAVFPSGHRAGQTLCKRKGDYLCFAGLADEERESPPRPASSQPGEGLGGAGGRCSQHPRQLAGVHRGLPGTREAAVSLGAAAVFWCALSPVRSQTSSPGLGFTDCPF